jgi:hypothetical protein
VADAVEPLLRFGGGIRVRDGAELTTWVTRLRDDPTAAGRAAAGAAVAARAMAEGAGRTLDFLHRFEWFGKLHAGGMSHAGGAQHAEATPGPDEATP